MISPPELLAKLFKNCSGAILEQGAQWLSSRVLDSRPGDSRFEPHRRHCVVSLSKNIYPSLVLVQPRKTRPYITERLLMGCKESNQTNKQKNSRTYIVLNIFLLKHREHLKELWYF